MNESDLEKAIESIVNENADASASSVQKAILSLQEKQLVTNDLGTYEVYDKFMALWLKKQIM